MTVCEIFIGILKKKIDSQIFLHSFKRMEFYSLKLLPSKEQYLIVMLRLKDQFHEYSRLMLQFHLLKNNRPGRELTKKNRIESLQIKRRKAGELPVPVASIALILVELKDRIELLLAPQEDRDCPEQENKPYMQLYTESGIESRDRIELPALDPQNRNGKLNETYSTLLEKPIAL